MILQTETMHQRQQNYDNKLNFFFFSNFKLHFSLTLEHLQYVSILVMCVLLGCPPQLQTSFENNTLFFS